MRIAFLLESTFLCGGVKVILRQAEALASLGYEVLILSEDDFPDWFDGKIDHCRKNPYSPDLASEFDVVIATTPGLALFHHKHSGPKKTFHMIQGYEGDYNECSSMMDLIHAAYSLSIVKMTISSRLASRLEKSFPGKYFSVGQGLETDFFYPGPDPARLFFPDKIFLVGPLSISIKQIIIGLKAFKLAQKDRPGLKLVRISPVDTRKEEENIVGPISEYHVHLKPREVGNIFRTGHGVLISPSGPGEGFGLPALEAMACGMPVVLTSIPSYTSFANPVDYACFVKHGDESSMCRGINDLLDDHAWRVRLILRGLEVASKYRFENVARKMESVFKDV